MNLQAMFGCLLLEFEVLAKIVAQMSVDYLRLIEKLTNKESLLDEMRSEDDRAIFTYKPFVTVSRDPGSGGKPVAKLVAKKLGFKFYDQNLLSEIAKSAKARKEILEDIDEKKRSMIEDLIHNVLNPEYISERRYITHLCKVVLRMAQKGGVVILGRGSNFITPQAFGLHVRITAPYRVCVARAVQYEKISYWKAREIIRKEAKERADFVKQYFGKDVSNPKHYDITLSTTYMSLEDAARSVLCAFRSKFPRMKIRV